MSKYTYNMSAVEAEKIEKLGENEVLISIKNNNGNPWDLKVSGEKVCRVFFDDVLFPCMINNLSHYPMTADHANQVIDFVEKNKDKNILVNCHAGISRSGAFCLFLHNCYGYDLKSNFWMLSEPNPLCLGLLVREYYRRK